MHAKHLAVFIAAACASLTTFAAGPATPGAAGAASAAAPHKAWINPAMARGMQGSYRLDDGRILRVSEKSRKLYADVGDGPVEIVHVGDDRFEAIGKDIGLRFEGAPQSHEVFARIGPQRQVASSQR